MISRKLEFLEKIIMILIINKVINILYKRKENYLFYLKIKISQFLIRKKKIGQLVALIKININKKEKTKIRFINLLKKMEKI